MYWGFSEVQVIKIKYITLLSSCHHIKKEADMGNERYRDKAIQSKHETPGE